MAKTRALRRRIRSVESISQVTRTMEMVSTSKLKRAQERVVGARPYAQALAETIADLLSPELAERFPLLRQPAPPAKGGPRRAAVLLVTSNRGLAGAFNANLIRAAVQRERELVAQGLEVDLLAVGKKGINYFKFLGRPVALARLDIGDRPQAQHAAELAQPLIERFEAGALASFDVVYAHFKSALSTPPVVERVLPIKAAGTEARGHGGTASATNFILRPGAEEILSALLPLYVRNMVFRALVETRICEGREPWTIWTC